MAQPYFQPDFQLGVPFFVGFYQSFMQERKAQNMQHMKSFLDEVDPTYYREQLQVVRENIKEYKMKKIEIEQAARERKMDFVLDMNKLIIQETASNNRTASTNLNRRNIAEATAMARIATEEIKAGSAGKDRLKLGKLLTEGMDADLDQYRQDDIGTYGFLKTVTPRWKLPDAKARMTKIIDATGDEVGIRNAMKKPEDMKTVAMAIHRSLLKKKDKISADDQSGQIKKHNLGLQALQSLIDKDKADMDPVEFQKEMSKDMPESSFDITTNYVFGTGVKGISAPEIDESLFDVDTTAIDTEIAKLKTEEDVLSQQASLMATERQRRLMNPYEILEPNRRGRTNIYFSQRRKAPTSQTESFIDRFTSITPRTRPKIDVAKEPKVAKKPKKSKKYPGLTLGAAYGTEGGKQAFGMDENDNPFVMYGGKKYSPAYEGDLKLTPKDTTYIHKVLKEANRQVLERLKKSQKGKK